MYKKKYQEYKKKYINEKEKHGDNVISFIEKASIEDFNNNFNNIITNFDTCTNYNIKGNQTIIISPIGETIKYKINNKFIDIPVVMKRAHENNSQNAHNIKIEDIEGVKYIYDANNMTMEYIAFLYINRLWKMGITPHLPLMINYGTCGKFPDVNILVTEKQGLDYKIKIFDYDNYTTSIYSLFSVRNDEHQYSSLATYTNLFRYIDYNIDDNFNIKLPTNDKNKMINANVVNLHDYISFSFIHTYYLLSKHNYHIYDLFGSNLFIHWLNEKSYMGDNYIGDAEYIYYKINNNLYKFKTNGFVMKFGDVGVSIINPNSKLVIITQCVDFKFVLKKLDEFLNFNLHLANELTWQKQCGKKFYENTAINKLFSTHPYNKISNDILNKKLLSKLMDINNIFKLYDKYRVDKINENEKYIIINNF